MYIAIRCIFAREINELADKHFKSHETITYTLLRPTGGPCGAFPTSKSKAIVDDKSVSQRSTRGKHDPRCFKQLIALLTH